MARRVLIHRMKYSSIVKDEEIESLRKELEDLLVTAATNCVAIAIDFSQTFHVSSRALGVLIAIHKRVVADSGALAIFGANAAVVKVLEVTRINTLISQYSTEQEAVAALNQ